MALRMMGSFLRHLGGCPSNELEDLLMAAINANQDDKTGALTVIDDYFSGDETFEGPEYKRALLQLLGLLWPNLAHLLGGPQVEQ